MKKDICEWTFSLGVRIIRVCQYLDEKPGMGQTLAKQLLRAGTAIGSNVEEAHAEQSAVHFINKMMIADKAARETCYWLRLLAAAEVLPKELISKLQMELEELTRFLGAIIISTSESKNGKPSNF